MATSAILACSFSACGGNAATETHTFFSPHSFWNDSLPADAAINPGSHAMVSKLVHEVKAELARRSGPGINTRQWSTPVYRVGSSQRRVKVTLDRDLPSLQRAFDAVPIPPGAKPAKGNDHQMVVWQPSTDSMWEFFEMEHRSGGWHAFAGGAMHSLSTNPGYFNEHAWKGAQPWWGATASGLPLLGGLMTLRELATGQINHALALAIPAPRKGVWSWPATRTDGTSLSPTSLPEGARLRLDPRLDIASLHLPPLTRMMAEAAQRYGIVIRDRAANIAFYGQDPTPSGSNLYSRLSKGRYPDELLAQFPWSHLKVLALHTHR